MLLPVGTDTLELGRHASARWTPGLAGTLCVCAEFEEGTAGVGGEGERGG